MNENVERPDLEALYSKYKVPEKSGIDAAIEEIAALRERDEWIAKGAEPEDRPLSDRPALPEASVITSIIDYAKKLERDLVFKAMVEPLEANGMDFSNHLVLAKSKVQPDKSIEVLYLSKPGQGIDDARRAQGLSEWLGFGKHTQLFHPEHPAHVRNLKEAERTYAEQGVFHIRLQRVIEKESAQNPALAGFATGINLGGQEL